MEKNIKCLRYIAGKHPSSHVDGVLGKDSKQKLEVGCPLGLYLTHDLDYRRLASH